MGTPIRGFNGVVRAGGSDTVVGEVRSWEYTMDASVQDTSVMGTARTDIVNTRVRGSLTLFAQNLPGTDPAPDSGQALLTVGSSVALDLHPNGTGSGKPSLTGTVIITAERGSQEYNGHAMLSLDFELTGASDWTRTAQA